MLDLLMLQDPSLKQKLESYPWTGIYKLHCLTDDMKSVIPIERLLKQDTAGVLYIGASAYLPNRVEDLYASIAAALKSDPSAAMLHKHTCGEKYRNKRVQQKFPINKLCIQIVAADKDVNTDAHYLLENQELSLYESIFGEPPPWNEGRKSQYCDNKSNEKKQL